MAAPKGNQFALGNSGKPKKFKSPKDLQQRLEEYFLACDNCTVEKYRAGKVINVIEPSPYTIEGVCGVLDCDRKTLLNYEKNPKYKEYFHILDCAKRRIRENWVKYGISGKYNSNFTKFILYNNSDYVETSETDITTKGDKIDGNVMNVNIQDRICQIKEDKEDKEQEGAD